MEEENASHEKGRALVAARKAGDTDDKLMISKIQTLMLVLIMLINDINMVKRNGFKSILYVQSYLSNLACKAIKQHE